MRSMLLLGLLRIRLGECFGGGVLGCEVFTDFFVFCSLDTLFLLERLGTDWGQTKRQIYISNCGQKDLA